MSENEKTEQKENTNSRLSKLLDKLPPWMGNALRSKRQWKILVRCWVASWAAYILLMPDKSLRTLGNAYVLFCFSHVTDSNAFTHCSSFFALLASLMIPPNMPVQMFFFVSDTYRTCLGNLEFIFVYSGCCTHPVWYAIWLGIRRCSHESSHNGTQC